MIPLALALLLLAAPVRAAESPEAVVDRALDANPSLDAMRHREQALFARADVLGAWPDPVVSVEYSNAPVSTFDLADHPMAGLQLRVQQMLKPPTWSRTSRDVGTLEAEVAAHAAAEAELGLALAVRRAWWMLARTRLLRDVTRAHLARTEELLGAARVRYETGAVGQHAVLRLEVLRDKLSDELGEFDKSEAELTAMLVRAVAGEAGQTFDTPAAIEPLPPPEARDWRALAVENRPLLAGLEAEQGASEQTARLARTGAIPDPSVWAGYRIRAATDMDPGTDLVSIGIGVPIPTGSGRKAAGMRTAALEKASAAGASHEAAIDAIDADMAAILARWARAHAKAQTWEQTLIPGALATLQTTQADFTVGRADFASLFEAEVALLDLERGRIGAAVETHLQQAEATAVLGIAPGGSP